jgi:hypothetical protein
MSAPTAADGKDLVLSVGGSIIAGAEECTYDIEHNVQEYGPTQASFPDVGYAPGPVKETITTSGLFTMTDTPLGSLITAGRGGTTVEFSYDMDGTTVAGTAYVSKFTNNTNKPGQKATYTATLVCFNVSHT